MDPEETIAYNVLATELNSKVEEIKKTNMSKSDFDFFTEALLDSGNHEDPQEVYHLLEQDTEISYEDFLNYYNYFLTVFREIPPGSLKMKLCKKLLTPR